MSAGVAKALQCPDCSERHPLEEVAHLRTFRCRQCNRLLKVPAGIDGSAKRSSGSAKAPAKASAKGKAPPAAKKLPPSKRGAVKVAASAAVAPEDAATIVNRGAVAALKTPPSQRGDAIAEQTRKMQAVAGEPSPSPSDAPAPSGGATPARRAPRVARILAWSVAVPVGLIPVLVLGRTVGLVTVDRAVDVFVGVGWGRFLPPLLVLPLWAASSATVAHLMIEAVARLRSR